MIRTKKALWTGLATLALGWMIGPQMAQAVNVQFTIDPVSFLTLTATFNNVVLPEQGPGSRTANYTGMLVVDVDNALAPSSIQFMSSTATAGISGNWLPDAAAGPAAGNPGLPAPANYGVLLPAGAAGTAYAAGRDIVFNISSAPLPVVAGSYASTQSFTYASGFFDVNVPPAFATPPSHDDLTGDTRVNLSPTMSTYAVSGNTATLIISYQDLNPGGFTTSFAGRILATATVPEPSSLGLLSCLVGLGMRRVVGRRKP